MAKLNYKNGVTSVVLRVKIMDSASTTGGAKTGLTFSSTGLIISTIADNEATATAYTVAGSTIETITTLGTFATPTATKCRFKEVDSTNHPGLYEIQVANARWAVSSARSIIVSVVGATGAAQVDAEIQLEPVPANQTQYLDSAVPAANTAGYQVVDAAKLSGTSLTARDIGASVLLSSGTGTGQVSLSSGQVTVSANNDKTGYALSATQTFNNTGSWTGNLSGSVGSVTGNVGGSVASVTAGVTVATNNDKTGYTLTVTPPTAAAIATAVWTDLLASSDFSTASSIGKLLKDDIDAAVSSRMATYTQPTGFLAATFPTTVASPTNITAGTITTATNVTNAPTSGDFTATMKTSIGTAVAASAVASVTAAVTLPAIPTDWISAAGVSAAAVTKIQAGLSTYAGGDTAGTTTLLARLTATRAGYVDNLSAGVVPTAAQNAAAGWDLATSGHTTSGTFGAAMNAAGSAGDPWSTAVPGAYGAGTAGFILGTNLNATVSSRMATYTQPTGFLGATFPSTVASPTNITAASGIVLAAVTHTGAVIPRVTLADTLTTYTGNTPQTGDSFPSDSISAANTATLVTRLTAIRAGYLDNLAAGAVALHSDITGLSIPTAAVIAAATWDLATSGHTTSSTFGAAMTAAGSAGDPWSTSLPGTYGVGTAGHILGTNVSASLDPYALAHLYGRVVVGSDGSWTYFDPGTSTPRLRFDPIAAPGGRSVTLL